MLLRVLGIVLLVWIGFAVLGAVLDVLVWALVVGGVLFVGSAAVAGRLEARRRRRALGS